MSQKAILVQAIKIQMGEQKYGNRFTLFFSIFKTSSKMLKYSYTIIANYLPKYLYFQFNYYIQKYKESGVAENIRDHLFKVNSWEGLTSVQLNFVQLKKKKKTSR